MKILSLVAENIKRLTAVEIKPDGSLVVISGRNGAGKTSVLDSIWWALAGATHIQTAPIRKGQKSARIRLDLGELIVTRAFRKTDDGETVSQIAVENPEGARFPSPQTMLDKLLGALSFDPLAFSRMKPAEQFNQLRKFVPDVDFAAIANADRGDRERRTELGRLAAQERAAAQAITVPEGTPDVPVDIDGLVGELDRIGTHNASVDAWQRLRDRASDAVLSLRNAREALLLDKERIERRMQEIDEALSEPERIAAIAKPPMGPRLDAADVRQKISTARAVNDEVRRVEERRSHLARAHHLDDQVKTLTAKIEKREADKQAAIAGAKMPIEGIGFGEEAILLNGLPFEQASDAEQLRASVAIAMALNPKLRVIRIRDGSLLDEDALRLVGEMAQTNDMQVWIERVDTSGKIGFVIEDGHLKEPAA